MRHYVWFVFGIFYSLLLGLIAGCSSSPQLSSERSTLEDAVDSIKTAYIPDRRVQIFDFDLSDDGLRLLGKTSNPESYQAVQDLQTRRSAEHTSELQSRGHLVCRLLL